MVLIAVLLMDSRNWFHFPTIWSYIVSGHFISKQATSQKTLSYLSSSIDISSRAKHTVCSYKLSLFLFIFSLYVFPCLGSASYPQFIHSSLCCDVIFDFQGVTFFNQQEWGNSANQNVTFYVILSFLHFSPPWHVV